MEETKDIQEKILEFLAKNSNIILIVILIFAFYLRFKYFNINTAVWWDESEYLVTAKHWALDVPYSVAIQRQPLFPLLISVFYFLKISSEAVIRFFVVLIPSFLSVYLTYLLGKEFYDKYTGLIAAYIMAIFWVLLFNTARVHTDPIAFLFGLAAFYFFWKGYVKKQSQTLNLILTGLFLGLGFLIRVGGVLPVAVILFYLLITENIKILKKKKLYLTGIVSVVAISPYLIWNYFHFGNFLAFWELYFGARKSAIKFSTPIAWHLLEYFQQYTGLILFVIFLLGLAYLLNLILGFDLIIKNKAKLLSKSDLFTTLSILVPMIFFIFIERQAEPRWALIMAPAVFFIVAKGFKTIYNIISKFNKLAAVSIIVILLIAGSSYQLQLTDSQVQVRKDSFSQFRDAGLWLKENSNPEDLIYSNGLPQINYYSERFTWSTGGGSEEFLIDKLKKTKDTRFMVISLLEIEPKWLSTEEFGPTGLTRWALPYFESELLISNGQAIALHKGEPTDQFPAAEVIKDDLKFNLVYSIPALFIYEITYL